MNRDAAQPIEAWTAYWRSGRSTSCLLGTGTEVYLDRVWEALVDGLRDGARLLDLATGNGAVARVCAAHGRVRNIRLQIEAVDAAEIDPRSDVKDAEQHFSDVRFRPGVRLEALPYGDNSFDAVVSQFGFEYAEGVGAAGEAARVLAPGGRLRLVMHARSGAISRDIGRRLERLQTVLADDGPVALVLQLAKAAEAGDVATLVRKSARLKPASDLLNSLADRPPPDDAALYYGTECLRLWNRRERYRPADLRRSIEDGWINATGVAIRQAEMLRVARSAADMTEICARFAAQGLEVDVIQEIRDEQRRTRIAWCLDARKLRCSAP